jgi:hypothetical protein
MQPTVFLEQTQADENLVVKMLHVLSKFTHTLCPHVYTFSWILKEFIQAEH